MKVTNRNRVTDAENELAVTSGEKGAGMGKIVVGLRGADDYSVFHSGCTDDLFANSAGGLPSLHSFSSYYGTQYGGSSES